MMTNILPFKAALDSAAPVAAWPVPTALPSSLPPVPAFEADLLPAELRPWAVDIAERMNCPLDYIGISAMVGIGSLIGRRVGIRPETNTDWTEAANLWGCIVGPPGFLKSPAIRQALAPIHRLEAIAAEQYREDLAAFEQEALLGKIRGEEAERGVRALLKKGNDPETLSRARDILFDAEPPKPPQPKRYYTSDATAEKLGEICEANPFGLLIHRDELLTMMASLDDERNSAARGFFLSGWSGLDGYTFDRIQRGTVRIPAVNLSVLGTTQPNRLAGYLRDSLLHRDDGMVQRLQLLSWPDITGAFQEADRHPDSEARQQAFSCFDRLANINADQIGAEFEQFGGPLAMPYLRFDQVARKNFGRWRQDLEERLRSDELPPALTAHLSKFRGLMPRLALVYHLGSGGTGPVSNEACCAAIEWTEYLEAHAARAYASVTKDEGDVARAIWRKIKKGDLKDGFTARDIYKSGWSLLTDSGRVDAGLALLEEYDWLRSERKETGGRPTKVWEVNPLALN